MKTQIRKLRLIMRVLNPEWFWHIQITENVILLNGNYSDTTLSALNKYFKFNIDPDGAIRSELRNEIRISLK